MSVYKYFVQEGARRTELNEFLEQELKRAGYSKVELTKTPLGTRVVIYAARPGMVIGRRGQSIRDLTKMLEERFKIENPQLSVAPIEIPDLDPKVVASQLANSLQRGIHFRRAAYWALTRVLQAGALGVEITIRGKLTTERARYEKYRGGYLLRVGDPVLKQVRRAVVDVLLKQGLFGIQVIILPPTAEFPDRPVIRPEGAPPKVEAASVEEKKQEEEAEDAGSAPA